MNDDHVPAYPATVEMFPTRVRLPKTLRRRVGEQQQAVAPHDHAGFVPDCPDCERTWDQIADEPRIRCKCSHGPSVHTGGYGQCWTAACGCRYYRDKETK